LALEDDVSRGRKRISQKLREKSQVAALHGGKVKRKFRRAAGDLSSPGKKPKPMISLRAKRKRRKEIKRKKTNRLCLRKVQAR